MSENQIKVISDRHLRELGDVVVHFSYLERLVSMFIRSHLLDRLDRSDALIVVNLLSFRRQLDLLGALFTRRVTDKRLNRSLNSVLKRLATAETMRNNMMHSEWALADEDGQFPILVRYKPAIGRFKGLKHNFEEMGLQDLRKVVRFFDGLASDLSKLDARLRRWKGKHRSKADLSHLGKEGLGRRSLSDQRIWQ